MSEQTTIPLSPQPLLPWGGVAQERAVAPEGALAVVGKVERQLTERPGGWRMLLVVPEGGKPERWMGVCDRPEDDGVVEAVGRYEPDRRDPSTRVFRFDTLIERVPDESVGLIAFIAKLAKGVGAGLARRIVDHFGPMTADILDRDPMQVVKVPGISADKATRLGEAWAKKRSAAAVIIFLLKHGVQPYLARRIAEHFEDRTRWVIENDPYRITEVDGIAFARADQIAIKLGIDPLSISRAEAAVVQVLGDETFSGGHTYCVEHNAVTLAAKLIDDDPRTWQATRERVGKAIASLLTAERPRILRSMLDGHPILQLATIARAEHDTADRLRILASTPLAGNADDRDAPLAGQVDQVIARFEADAKIKLAPIQREAVAMAAREKVLVITGGPGTGKCLKTGTPILMFDGTVRPVEEVHDGDLLMGPDSKPRRVSGTTSGTGPLYEIRPTKGTPWVCNDVHVLTLVRSGTNAVRDIALNDYLALSHGAKWRQRGKLFKVGVDFPEQPVAVDPYIVGVWIGDGTRSSTCVTTAEPEIVDALRDKHLPYRYKVNSRANRLQLLAGIVDTDGYVGTNNVIEVATKWRALADDIAFLARSLGICVTIAEKYVRLEGWDEAQLYYRIILSGHLDQIPSRVPRRKVPARLQIKDALRTGFDVVPVGIGNYYGFQLDGDGRFLLGDFTVTHNTTILQGILSLYKSAKIPVCLCAPTGRAAKRMNEATRHAAATIHRTLGFDPVLKGFLHRAGNPLPDCGAVAVDEMSMVDAKLAADLLAAIPTGARVVFIGDVDQLPSVGPGSVLRDLIDSGTIPTVRLTQIFRQAEGSAIIDNAHRINAGRPPVGDEGPRGEFYVFKREGGAAAAALAVELVTRRIPNGFGIPARDIQLLTPMHRGPAGTMELNRALQAALNPPREGVAELTRGDVTFRVGDKVLVTKNDAQRDVYNGDLGVIEKIADSEDGKRIVVSFDDNRHVSFQGGKQLDGLRLAYAMSTHKSQGSTFVAVVQLLLPEHRMLLSRPLLYTGITRPRKLAVLITEDGALRRALRETESASRRTRLAKLLRDQAPETR